MSRPRVAPSFAAALALSVAVPVVACLLYGLHVQPILRDRATFVYAGQAVHAGASLYGDTPCDYPPLGPLLLAVSMWIGEVLFSLPTWLSPRYAGVVLHGATAGAVFVAARRGLGSDVLGLVAALAFGAFGFASRLAVTSLEPKAWVMLFLVLGIVFAERRRWFLVGLVTGLSTAAWQCAIVGAVAFAAAAWLRARRRGRALGWLVAGGLASAVPFAVYLAATGSWAEFWNNVVSAKLASEATVGRLSADAWLRITVHKNPPDVLVWAAGGAGLLLLLGRLRRRETRRELLSGPLSEVLLLSIVWIVFSALVDFDGGDDSFPLVLVTAILIAVLARAAGGGPRRTGAIVVLVLVAGYFDVFTYDIAYTLDDEIRDMRTLAGDAPLDRVVPVDCEEFLVFTETRFPASFARLSPHEDEINRPLHGVGFEGPLAAVRALRPRRLVVGEGSGEFGRRVLEEHAGAETGVSVQIRKSSLDVLGRMRKQWVHRTLVVREGR